MEIIRVAHIEENLGYRRIIKKYGHHGLTLSGVKDAVGRLRGSGSLEREKGSGAPKVRRTDAKVEEARELTMGPKWVGGWATHSQMTNPKITCGEAAKELGLSESTTRRLLKEELDCKPTRQVKSKRVKPGAAQKRLECCRAWLAQIESGELDPRKIYWADENLLRLGACP